MSRGLPTKDFSGALVEHFLIGAELLIRDQRQIGALGQVVADAAVLAFAGAAFPGAVRVTEEDLQVEVGGQQLVFGHLLALIIGEGFEQSGRNGLKFARKSFAHAGGVFLREVAKKGETGRITSFCPQYQYKFLGDSRSITCVKDLKNTAVVGLQWGDEGKNVNVEMGSYGIGVSRLVAVVIEAKCVEGVMKWPLVISPFDIAIIPLNNKSDTAPLDKARKIYENLKHNSIDAILDDTLESPSSKFKNFDLIGVPYQIIIGSKSNDDKLEFKELNAKTEMLTIEEIIKKIKKLKG